MLTAIAVPALDSSSAKAVLLRVLVKPGDTIVAGVAVAEIETEKAAFPIESAYGGTVQKLLADAGQEVNVGAVIATLETSDSGATPYDPAAASTLVADGKPAAAAHASSGAAALYTCTERSRVLFNDGFPAPAITLAPPRATAFADDGDAQNYAARNVPLAESRKLMGSALRTQQRMLWSARNIPSSSVALPMEIGALRQRIDERRAVTRQLLNVTDVVLWAAARTLRNFPELNAYRCRDELRLYKDVNIGIVYDIKGELVVPSITAADTLSVAQFAEELRALYRAVTARKVPVAKLGTATFTVSNLFGSGATHASPLVNAGQSGVLLIGAPFTMPIQSNDALRFAEQVNLVLGFDHSIVNGARAAAFLKAVVRQCSDAEI
jgi:pyruvate dehydrogenase E2 component (dihydrolipoamide acetyltransferase)